MVIDFREREKGRGRGRGSERERERETPTVYLPYAPQLGIEPAT